MAESKIPVHGLVPLTNGSQDIGKYNLFVIQLKDNWASGSIAIQVMFAKTGQPTRYTWDWQEYHNQFELSLNGNNFSVTSQYTTTPNQNTPTIVSIYGVC